MKSCFLLVWLAVVSSAAHAQSSVALITAVDGGVQVREGERAESPAHAFGKLKAGDHVLTRDGHVRIVYFAAGIEESWGPNSEFDAGTRESRATKGKPVVKELPRSAPRGPELARIESIDSLNRMGAVRIRGVKAAPRDSSSFEAVAVARKAYEDWRKQAEPDDLLPDLYYFSVLQEYGLHDEMTELATSVQARAPDAPLASSMSRAARHP